jgi:hypothetical protein
MLNQNRLSAILLNQLIRCFLGLNAIMVLEDMVFHLFSFGFLHFHSCQVGHECK